MQNTLNIVDRLYKRLLDFYPLLSKFKYILSSDEIDLFSPLGAKNGRNDTNQPPMPLLLIPLNCSGT